jgi:hypothetical protein
MSDYAAAKSGLNSDDIGSAFNIMHYRPDAQIIQLQNKKLLKTGFSTKFLQKTSTSEQ